MARISKVINLTESDKLELLRITKSGTHKGRKVTRAFALLSMAEGNGPLALEQSLGLNRNAYYTLKRRYLLEGLSAALDERPRSGRPPKITERIEAQITSIACSDAPAGSSKWTLSLINDKLVELCCEHSLSSDSRY